MNIKDLKVGDAIYIKEDLEVGKRYGSAYFAEGMKQGVQSIMSIDSAEEDFNIASDADSFRYHYTPEMIDWEKTMNLKDIQAKEYLNERFGDNTAHNPSHYGGDSTYADVKKEVEKVKVKWVPKDYGDYYTVDGNCKIECTYYLDSYYDRDRIAVNNCFKTREEAIEKAEKIKEVLRGE